MKNTFLKKKFRKKFHFVRPLYSRAKFTRRITPKTNVLGDGNSVRDLNLCGHAFGVKRKFIKHERVKSKFIKIQPCVSGFKISFRDHVSVMKLGNRNDQISTKRIVTSKQEGARRTMTVSSSSKQVGVSDDDHNETFRDVNRAVVIHKLPDTWLRVYPAPKVIGEPIYSVILRCLTCQLGMAAILVLWTIVWVYVIYTFEEPHEKEVSLKFEKEQNQLIIDLATELRQITPISPKWRDVIEKRIVSERELTILAVGRGARLHPGCFWDLSGTFLFTIYVMTALGFGAPVPQTVWGRTSALIYAVIAVPAHIYLMVNLSTFVVIKVEEYVESSKRSDDAKKIRDNISGIKKGNPNYSKNGEYSKLKSDNFQKKILCALGMLCVWRGVPIATALYYTLGALSFGVLRNKQPLDIVMFPLEFTTSGGLEGAEGYIRIVYGVYVEGAMVLLACGLAALRRHSGAAVSSITEKYRLFDAEKCGECEARARH